MADKTKSDLFRLLYYYRKTRDFQGWVRLHCDTAKGNRDVVWNCTVKWKEASTCTSQPLCSLTPLPSTDMTSWQLFPAKKKQQFFSTPPLYIETHVLKADFKLLKVDKSKGRTCTVAKTFGYYSELEAAEVGWPSESCPIPPIPTSLCHSEMRRRQSDHGARTTFSFLLKGMCSYEDKGHNHSMVLYKDRTILQSINFFLKTASLQEFHKNSSRKTFSLQNGPKFTIL